MSGLIYETGAGRYAFISHDAIISITETGNDGFEVWYAKGYTNTTAVLSKDELKIRPYEQYLDIINR